MMGAGRIKCDPHIGGLHSQYVRIEFLLETNVGRPAEQRQTLEPSDLPQRLTSFGKGNKMNWEAISGIANLLAALGVIITLVYLAIQIRQNTRSSRTNRQNEIAREFAERQMTVASNTELLSVITRCRNQRSDDFSPEDRERVLAWTTSMINTYLSIAVAHQNGEMTDEMYDAYCQDVLRTIEAYPGALHEWHQVCNYFPVFKRYKIFDPVVGG
jgi:hypothetical protein